MKKYFAELVGTFILVLFGCGTAVGRRRQGRHPGHRIRLRPWARRGCLRNWTDLRLPHQPRSEPGSVGSRPNEIY